MTDILDTLSFSYDNLLDRAFVQMDKNNESNLDKNSFVLPHPEIGTFGSKKTMFVNAGLMISKLNRKLDHFVTFLSKELCTEVFVLGLDRDIIYQKLVIIP